MAAKPKPIRRRSYRRARKPRNLRFHAFDGRNAITHEIGVMNVIAVLFLSHLPLFDGYSKHRSRWNFNRTRILVISNSGDQQPNVTSTVRYRANSASEIVAEARKPVSRAASRRVTSYGLAQRCGWHMANRIFTSPLLPELIF